MKPVPPRVFIEMVHRALDDTFRQHNFAYRAAHLRPLGVAMEFTRGDDLIFAVHEGGVVYLDAIRHVAECTYRVSINQALWFQGVPSVARQAAVDEQLALFQAELPSRLSTLLDADPDALDPRYCFPVSRDALGRYLAHQRGERAVKKSAPRKHRGSGSR